MNETRPSTNSEAVERAARAICRALDVDPDAQVYPGVPLPTQFGYIPQGDAHPAWTSYCLAAQRALDAEWVHARRQAADTSALS